MVKAMDYILSAKLRIPDCPPQLIARPRLMPNEVLAPITAVCAPAGYGKTTLISTWAKSLTMPCAWLSLDATDNDPTQFMLHLISAIQSQYSQFAQNSTSTLTSTQLPAILGLTRSLLNELGKLPDNLCLIIDDLHCLNDHLLHDALAFMVEHLPPQLHLIFISRNTLPFSLTRLRVQHQLCEIHTEDLRFTRSEVVQFCNEAMQLNLSAELIDILNSRTEGWIVGLQLAALSLHNCTNKKQFIQHFAGDDRHITDFLMDEVLHQLSHETQQFLLYSCILQQFNASLCDSVCEQQNSRQLIDELERNQLFISCLDHKRGWYRYHHLFASLLKARLEHLYPEQVKGLHHRASLWFKAHDFFGEAIQHGINAGDYEFAAELMEQHSSHLFSLGRFTTALKWAYQLPSPLLAKHPKLSMLCAWAGLVMDNMPEVERHTQAAALHLEQYKDAPCGTKERALFGQLAFIRGCQYCLAGDVERAQDAVMDALGSLSPKQVLYKGASVCLAFCYYVQGDINTAQRLFEENAHINQTKYNLMIPLFATLGLARCHLLRGELDAAEQIYNQALAECAALGWQDVPVCGMLHLGLGELAYEKNDLVMAVLFLEKGIEMTRVGQMQYFTAWGRVLLAQTQLALQQDVSLSAKDEADLIAYAGRFLVEIPPLSAALAQLWLNQGRTNAFQQWLRNAQLPTKSSLTLERGPEYLVLSRYLMLEQRYNEALELLEQLWGYAQEQQQRRMMVEICILKAVTYLHEHQDHKALAALQHALICAHDSHFIRLFCQENVAIHGLLQQLAPVMPHHPLLQHLIRAMGDTPTTTYYHIPLQNQTSLNSFGLSKKERVVAKQIVTGASNQEIAQNLCVSLSTVKTHTQNIYSKLGVNKRPQAIEALLKINLAS
jgi:LuxR family maltose regulon positive regulatory protein